MSQFTLVIFARRSRNLVLLALLIICGGGLFAAQEEGFSGRIVVEWVDDNQFVAAMRLVETFSFTQVSGKTWLVPAGSIVDGRSMSPLFVRLFGHPFDGGYRKSAVVYDYATKVMSEPWQDAQQMFFDGSVAEGILPIEAKVMYLLLSATGPRWVVRGKSSCFDHCHTADGELTWRPRVDDDPVVALVSWVRDENPSLEQIDSRVGEVILHPGPHIFGYVGKRRSASQQPGSK